MTTNTTSIKYKIGASIRTELSVFPFNNEDYELIENMETRYSITNLNAELSLIILIMIIAYKKLD